MVTKELSEAAVEFNCILSNASPEIIKKIPKSFINFMKDIASTTYKFDYDKSKKLNEQTLKLETRGLISLVYSDYICNDKEKEEYINKCQNYLKIKEQEAREKYNPDKLFKNSKLKTKKLEKTLKRHESCVTINMCSNIAFFGRIGAGSVRRFMV